MRWPIALLIVWTGTTAGAAHAAPAQPISVLVIGDSNTENGHITGELMRRWEKEFGPSGSGYHSLNAMVGTGIGYLPDLKITNGAGFVPYVMVPGNKDAPAPYIAPDGTAARSEVAGAATTVEFAGTGADLYYLASPDAGSFSVAVDGTKQPVECRSSGYETRRVRIQGLKAGVHTLSATSDAGRVTLLGVDTFKAPVEAKRPVVHKWGRRYATTQNFLDVRPEVFDSGLKLLAPDAVVILLGTNDHNITGTGWAGYGNNLMKLVGRVREALPGAHVLIASTGKVGVGRSRMLHDSYLEHLPAVTTAMGVSYWDLADYIGPTEDHKDLMADALHWNAAGGARIAEKLDEVLGDLMRQPLPQVRQPGICTGEKTDTKLLAAVKGTSARFWLAADGPVIRDASGEVTAWLDNSGAPTRQQTRAAACQWQPSLRPKYEPAAMNGHPALHFDGQDDFLHADFLDNGATSFVFVLKANDTKGALLGHSNTAIPSPDLLARFEGEAWVNGKAESKTALPTGKPIILCATPKGNTAVFLLGLSQTADNQTIQERYFNGDIAEVLCFYPALNETSRPAVEDYLSQKYSIALERP